MFSDYENFVYLMAELELIIEGGTIRWSLATANATKHRLNELRRRVDSIIAQIEDG
ncbi:MAG: hypothetical protein JO227_00505 [Acetobacteraceae bacterium]|nr:hypothetical protein [Acetobacteraceae bacterium]